ncbi:magnesium transporter CorA family protein [Lentilactobacillus sp. Marseille-Q4993]|uniref:magnesium transporter CorA family protein n=1 Tax=Lentilactobacillus sp. Marseille-Q4993 TaxID=3039492 RepID=UPI0024BCB897|nr:magnesium transporter CorA family protein [Lentilactobacillus sp. Marseille-Q4993]
MIRKEQVSDKCEMIEVYEPTPDEKTQVKETYAVTDEMFGYAYDIDERARIEFDEDRNLMMVIYDTVMDSGMENPEKDPTAPVMFLFNRSKLLVFTSEDTHFVAERIRGMKALKQEYEPLDVVLAAMYELSKIYFGVIHKIDTSRQRLQKSLQTKVNKSSVSQLMGLQTHLVYYLTSLRSNSSLLADLQHNRDIDINEGQLEQIDDDLIELKQGLEMADMASDVIEHVADAYKSVLDIELNGTMKLLTIYSILLALPQLVFGFYGQNVKLPLANEGWIMTIAWSAFLLIAGGILLNVHQRK